LYSQNVLNVTHYTTSITTKLLQVAVLSGFLRYGFLMTIEYLTKYWALLIASVLGLAVLLFVVFRVYQDSSRGRLQAAFDHLRERQKAAQAASKAVDKAVAKLDRLQGKPDSIAPRQVEAAREALGEAREVQKLVDDQVLVVKNNVRIVIVEDYPPKRHEAMLSRYLDERT